MCIHYSLLHITICVLCVYIVYIKLYIYESNIFLLKELPILSKKGSKNIIKNIILELKMHSYLNQVKIFYGNFESGKNCFDLHVPTEEMQYVWSLYNGTLAVSKCWLNRQSESVLKWINIYVRHFSVASNRPQ